MDVKIDVDDELAMVMEGKVLEKRSGVKNGKSYFFAEVGYTGGAEMVSFSDAEEYGEFPEEGQRVVLRGKPSARQQGGWFFNDVEVVGESAPVAKPVRGGREKLAA